MGPAQVADAVKNGYMSIGEALTILENIFGSRQEGQDFLTFAAPVQWEEFIRGSQDGPGLLTDQGGLAPQAGQQLRPSDVFRGFLANQPVAQNPLLRRAASAQLAPSQTQFLLQSPDVQGAPGGQNAFGNFLESGRALRGGALQDRLGLVGNITSLSDADFLEQFGSEGLAPLLRQRFLSGEQSLSNQLDAVKLPFQQFAGSPEARRAFESQIGTVFDRFINQNPEGNFLNFARDRNLFGAFR